MYAYTLPHFGELDPSKLEDYYNVDIDFNGSEMEIDLNFESNSIDPLRLDIVKKFIENLPTLDKANKQYINQDYVNDNCDTVRTYVEYHLEELGEDELKGIVDFNNNSIEPDKQLINTLHLVRMGLYPDNESKFAVFDYSISREITNDLVVILTDQYGNLDHMTMES